MIKHGYSGHPLYRTWKNIKTRCYNSNYYKYDYYGGRGISMCDEWKNDPKMFIEWCVDSGWKTGLEIDREDNDGDYSPENCRFITPQKNRCNTRLLNKNNSSGFRGVYFCNTRKTWVSRISINGKMKHIGRFKNKEDAAIAYDKEAIRLNDGRPLNGEHPAG